MRISPELKEILEEKGYSLKELVQNTNNKQHIAWSTKYLRRELRKIAVEFGVYTLATQQQIKRREYGFKWNKKFYTFGGLNGLSRLDYVKLSGESLVKVGDQQNTKEQYIVVSAIPERGGGYGKATSIITIADTVEIAESIKKDFIKRYNKNTLNRDVSSVSCERFVKIIPIKTNILNEKIIDRTYS